LPDRPRLRLPPAKLDNGYMLVVVEHKGELYSLMTDSVGEVLTASADTIEKIPANLDSGWKEVASGICKLQDELLVIVDVRMLLHITP